MALPQAHHPPVSVSPSPSPAAPIIPPPSNPGELWAQSRPATHAPRQQRLACSPMLGKRSNLLDNKLSSAHQLELGKAQALVVPETLNVKHSQREFLKTEPCRQDVGCGAGPLRGTWAPVQGSPRPWGSVRFSWEPWRPTPQGSTSEASLAFTSRPHHSPQARSCLGRPRSAEGSAPAPTG